MERKEIFNEQWHGIQEIVLSDAKRQIKFYGKVDVKRLSAKMQEEIAKWSQGILAQGVWFQTFHSSEPNKALDFMTIAMEQTIHEPANNQMPSNKCFFLLAFVLTGFLAWLLHSLSNISVVEQCFYPVLSFVVLNALYAPIKSKRLKSAENRIINDISNQMNEMEHLIEKTME